MPRMTRAALKAQAQADECPEIVREIGTEKENDLQRPHPTLIHEDSAENETGDSPKADTHRTDNLAVRQALRDITEENYPKADLNVEVQSLSPVKCQTQQQEAVEDEAGEAQNLPKSSRKPRGKAKGRTKKKTNAPTVVETEGQQSDEPVLETAQLTGKDPSVTNEPTAQQLVVEQISGPGPAVEEDASEINCSRDSITKTPNFDPAVHILDEEQARAPEDSFAHSITSRSPSKLDSFRTEQSEVSQSTTSSLQALTTLRRTSSTNFEESFEALDSLEDTIEQMTAGLPLLSAEEMHSPDSSIKNSRRSVRIETTAATPKTLAIKTPRATSTKVRSMVKTQDKENTPPTPKTPLQSKTPSKGKTPVTKEVAPLKPRTPSVRQSSPLKDGALSVRKGRTPAKSATTEAVTKKPMRASEPTASPAKGPRQSSMMSNTVSRAQPAAKKPVSTSQRASSQRQVPATKKPVAPVQAEIKKAHQVSMSFSISPVKQAPNAHKRRVTSGAVLSTSKPGFVPAKSTKPPTVSTFALPGEAVAEKLKAQKEAREEKMKQPKATLAEQKAAKLKADREAREERVRLNQLKAKENAEEKENKKPQRPVSMSALSVSKARAEAAERGRQASKEWAERMMLKKRATTEVKATPAATT